MMNGERYTEWIIKIDTEINLVNQYSRYLTMQFFSSEEIKENMQETMRNTMVEIGEENIEHTEVAALVVTTMYYRLAELFNFNNKRIFHGKWMEAFINEKIYKMCLL